MSINSLDFSDMADATTKWDQQDETATPAKATGNKQQQAAARRRIEMLRDIRECGLTIEEAKELGLLH
ncbi:hypothetical protein L4174_016880 [Photobacterium sp. CCB-ST2H9]|uniref:hypothetical protein n=1 Tax=unclassified Photobacterium TaxID=2628852 RepID=UPI002003E416|nr:hypothetical protein [Photobacterium sp. CCB-ST2H9]UTM59749.1 hypothetical protein L4174_016880 [Photobacterium sp. CCB-ST2H9]